MISLTLTGPLVRIEFGLVRPPENNSKTPQLVAVQTLVMPIDGLVKSFGIMDQAMKKLVESGAVKLRGENEAPAAA